MKPTKNAGRLLSTADSARIRKLSLERAQIVARLRRLDEQEIAAYVQPQSPTPFVRPLAPG